MLGVLVKSMQVPAAALCEAGASPDTDRLAYHFCCRNTELPCPAGVCCCQAAAAEARAKELQEELTATYKDKARVAEELVTAGRQLQIVRESNEAQACGLPR